MYARNGISMVRAIDHVTIVVSDLDRSVDFYTRVLDFKKTGSAHLEGKWIESVVGLKGVKAEVAYLELNKDNPRLELLCFQSPKSKAVAANSIASTIGMRHLAFRVKDIGEMKKRLEEAGAKVVGDPAAVPLDVDSGDSRRKVLFYFLDPDGVLLELAQYT